MYTQIEKPKENKGRAVASYVAQKKNRVNPASVEHPGAAENNLRQTALEAA